MSDADADDVVTCPVCGAEHSCWESSPACIDCDKVAGDCAMLGFAIRAFIITKNIETVADNARLALRRVYERHADAHTVANLADALKAIEWLEGVATMEVERS